MSDNYNGQGHESLLRNLYYRALKVNWKMFGKYAAFGATGALGNFFGPEITDFIGVKSQFMGIERTIAAEQITRASAVLGGLLGLLLVYAYDRYKR